MSATFNVSDLSLFDVNGNSNLRSNSLEEGGNDEDMARSKVKDPLEGLGRPMTRARTKKAKEALQQVLTMLFEYRPKTQVKKPLVINCSMVLED